MRHQNPLAANRLLRSAAGFAITLGLTGFMNGTALAQLTIDTATSAPVTTADEGDITIGAATGSITLTDNVGPALTVNSNNDAVNNGSLTIESDASENGVDNAIGVRLEGGADRSFTQTGSISIQTTAQPTNTDDDVLPDGPFAQGTGRTGILISGASPFEGNVELEAGSTIAIEGNDSFGINLDNTPMTQAGLTGNLLTGGTISIVGEDNTAINVASNVTGDVNNSGGISTLGGGSGAFNITGDIDGGFINSGVISTSGFRSNTRPATADGATGRDIFGPEDLMNAASAINIEGNITNGVFLGQGFTVVTDANGEPVPNTTPVLDANGDPVLDADGNPTTMPDGTFQMVATSLSDIDQFGSAPAIVINGNGTPIALGTVSPITDINDPNFDENLQFAFVNQGTVTAAGTFDDFDATVFEVTNATLEGGINNQGTLTASAFVSPIDLQDPIRGSGIARVIVLGDQAIADTINNSGVILASASEATDVVFADINNPIAPRDVIATAIDISADAQTGLVDSTLNNTGTISAVIIGRQGEAIAIRDSSGALTAVNNSGVINALGTNSDGTAQSVTDFNLVALDASNNTTGVTFTQTQLAGAAFAPSTNGDILLGSGDDTITSSAGIIVGDIDFGGGNDALALSGSSFVGNIENSANLNLTATQGASVALTGSAPVNLANASFDGTSNFSPVIDGNSGLNAGLAASGDITFAAGATINPILTNVIGLTDAGSTDFVIAEAAGDLTVGEIATLASGLNPFLFNTDLNFLDGNAATNTLVVTLDLRNPEELGLDQAQTGIDGSTFDAVIENLSNATDVGNAFAGITDGFAFNAAYNQILPEIGAAARQFILAGVDGTTGAVGTHLDAARRSPDKPGGVWLQHFAYFADRELAGNSEQFRGDGFGFTGGVDTSWGPFHAVGVNVGFSSTQVEDVVGQDDPLDITTLQGGAYAGLAFGNLGVSAYAGGGISDFEQDRQVDVNDFFGTAQGDWTGTHINGSLRAGYDVELSEKYWIRPSVSLDYLRLSEDAYTEEGTFGVALEVDERTSETGSASAVINLGARYEGRRTWIKPSLRVGYKYDFINDPTVTNFRFAGGNSGGADFLATQTASLQSFLFPDQGLLLGFSISAGSIFSSVSLDFDSDIRDGFIRHTGRVVFRLLF